MIIYKATNLINGKAYIGKTNYSLEKRKNGHLRSSKNPKTVFHQAINKYGADNFEFVVLEELKLHKNERLNKREIYYIALLDTKTPNGYNMTEGGDGQSKGYKSPMKGIHFLSEEAKEKIREKRKNQIFSEETKKKRSDSLKKAYAEGKRVVHSNFINAKKHFEKGHTPWNKGMEGFLKGKISWNKGLTKKDHPSIARQAEKVSNVIAWNKGLTKETDARVKKYSESLINSSNPNVFKKGHTPWNQGLHIVHSEESNKKRSETMKGKKKSLTTIENMKVAQRKRRAKQMAVCC